MLANPVFVVLERKQAVGVCRGNLLWALAGSWAAKLFEEASPRGGHELVFLQRDTGGGIGRKTKSRAKARRKIV